MSQNFPSNNKRAPNGGNFAQFNTRKTHKTNTFSNFPNNSPLKPSISSNRTRTNSNTNYLPSSISKPVNDFKSNDFHNVNTFKHPKPIIKSLDINERRKHRMANHNSFGRKKKRTQREDKKEEDDDDDDDDKKDDLQRNRYFDDRRKMNFTAQQRRDTLMGLANCKDNKQLIWMREYEILYKIPLLSYMYDIMGLLRVRKGIKGENIDLLLHLLPCNGGIFHNLWRRQQQKQAHWLSQNKLIIPKEIKQMLTLSRQEYASDLPQIPLPNQIKFKVDGIWETDVKIVRAFNYFLYSKLDTDVADNDNVYDGEQCEYHIRIWCNGLVKEIEEEHKNNEESIYDDDDDEDDESEDDYDEEYQLPEMKTVEDDTFYTDIIKNCGKINIEDIIQQNKHLKIKTVKRQPLETHGPAIKTISRDKYDTPDIDYNYESMKDFVERICEGPAKGKTGQAVMILIDTRNDPEITCYIWKKSTIFPDNIKNIKLGKNRIDYRKHKYFDLKYNGRTVNVGQYIGLSTLILERSIHQFWNIFNTEIRFEPDQALNLWPDFYKNQTLFEVVTDFENQYKNKDQEKQEKYRKYFGGDLVDKLNKKNSKFKYDAMRQIKEKNDEIHKNKKEHIVRNDDDDEEKPAAPDIDDFKPFVYHHKNTRIVWDLQQDLKGRDRQRIIIDLSPKQFKQVMAHSMAFTFKDVANDDDEIN